MLLLLDCGRTSSVKHRRRVRSSTEGDAKLTSKLAAVNEGKDCRPRGFFLLQKKTNPVFFLSQPMRMLSMVGHTIRLAIVQQRANRYAPLPERNTRVNIRTVRHARDTNQQQQQRLSSPRWTRAMVGHALLKLLYVVMRFLP